MTLEPFKIVGQLVACEKDENNDIVGERVVAEMVLYAPHFGDLEQRVRDAWPDIEAAAAMTERGAENAGNGGAPGLARKA
jgi:hypothetical protein